YHTDPILHQAITAMVQLNSLSNLSPRPEVNSLFSQLVTLAQLNIGRTKAETLLASLHQTGLLSRIHTLCAQGESALETHWAKHLAQTPSDLTKFPYYKNYTQQIGMETELLNGITSPSKPRNDLKLLFVGSGPLPLSALLYAESGYHVTCMDNNPNANHLAQSWISELETKPKAGQKPLEYITQQAERFEGYDAYDIVVLGAMVGRTTHHKENLITTISRQQTALDTPRFILARSTSSLGGTMRPLLYPEAPKLTHLGYALHSFAHPPSHSDVINSALLWQKTSNAQQR
ncbi:MAG: nicotianamine synthase family protein, partial [Alphaproteobacteria bacterium]